MYYKKIINNEIMYVIIDRNSLKISLIYKFLNFFSYRYKNKNKYALIFEKNIIKKGYIGI